MSTYTNTITAEIRCVNKTDRYSAHERIGSVGGVNPDGGNWKLSVEAAVAGIETGKYRFYVERPVGHRVWVVVAKSSSGHKYLKTESDGEQPNNLLALPECP
ncbi:MAG TPA: DUF3892 domain-containing protein [Acidimicrobiales bacterium]|jgi:hypothetical protein